jgi:hypothetical protein
MATPQPSEPPATGVEVAGGTELGLAEGVLEVTGLVEGVGFDVAEPTPALDEPPGGVAWAVDAEALGLLAGGATLEDAPPGVDVLNVGALICAALV